MNKISTKIIIELITDFIDRIIIPRVIVPIRGIFECVICYNVVEFLKWVFNKINKKG